MTRQRGPTPTAAERACAVIALVAFVVAIGLLLFGAVANLPSLLLLVGAQITTVVAGWYAASRRGATRVVAIVVVGAALVALVLAFTLVDITGWRIAATLAAGIVSVVAAGIALRTAGVRRPLAPAEGTRVPPASHPVLLMNPRSGGGKVETFHLVDECRTRGIEPVVLGPGDDLLKLAEDAVAGGADVIGMAGGDGSQALVSSVASAHDIPHVVVPAGTRNHLALDLGLDRDDVVGALDAFGDALERRVDLADVNGRVFVNNASLGLYAKIVQSPEYRDAKLQTTASMLPDLIGPDAEPLDLRFDRPDGEEIPTAQLIQVSNDPYQLQHAGGRGTRERMDLGVLGVVAVRIAGAAEAQRLVSLEAIGRLDRFDGYEEWTAPTFEIRSSSPVEIGVDGEALTMDPPLVFASHPGVLRVRLPRHAPGRSPAARAKHLTARSTLAELVLVARGRP